MGEPPRAHAVGPARIARGLRERGVRGQAQVVVAAKGQHERAIDPQLRALPGHGDTALAAQLRALDLGQARGDFIEPGSGRRRLFGGGRRLRKRHGILAFCFFKHSCLRLLDKH